MMLTGREWARFLNLDPEQQSAALCRKAFAMREGRSRAKRASLQFGVSPEVASGETPNCRARVSGY